MTTKEKYEKRENIIRKVADIFVKENLTTYDVKYICGILSDNSNYKERKEIFPLPFELIFVDNWHIPKDKKDS